MKWGALGIIIAFGTAIAAPIVHVQSNYASLREVEYRENRLREDLGYIRNDIKEIRRILREINRKIK